MKKWKICIIVILVLAVLLAVRCLTLQEVVTLEAYSLKYGMLPCEVKNHLGEPTSADTSMEISSFSLYSFEAPLLEYPATIGCFFFNDFFLSQVHIQWELDSDEQAQAITDKVEQIVKTKYQEDEDYYWKQNDYVQADYAVSVGTNEGATGIIYSIQRTGNVVTVLCIYNY